MSHTWSNGPVHDQNFLYEDSRNPHFVYNEFRFIDDLLHSAGSRWLSGASNFSYDKKKIVSSSGFWCIWIHTPMNEHCGRDSASANFFKYFGVVNTDTLYSNYFSII